MDMRLPHRTSQHQPKSHGFNLSRWAIAHTNFTRFLLVLILSAGIFAFTNLGQKEDPDFTFWVMIVQVLWPGSPSMKCKSRWLIRSSARSRRRRSSIMCSPIRTPAALSFS